MVPAAKTKKATQPTARLRGKKVASAQKSPRVFRLGQSTTTGEIPSRKTEEKSALIGNFIRTLPTFIRT
ncbi:hypothetical protein, partial [Collinsella sp. AF11-11]|uniref:hypothetical protein n=1 Tax=Collinsella sp. AF11-11 TaxID=2292212 RepID=UPI001F338CFA